MKSSSIPTLASAGTLFVSFLYPSMAGTGAQIRSASLVRMLAARGPVHVIVVGLVNMAGPCDSCVELGVAAITYVRIALKDLPSRQGPAKGNVPTPDLPRLNCEAAGLAALLDEYGRKHGLERLFVFRMEALTYVQGCLDSFPIRLLDLDELPSRHHRLLAELGDAPTGAVEKRAQLAAQILEKKVVPRFHRIFASSQAEAELVVRQTGCPSFVLPNIRLVSTKSKVPPVIPSRSIEFLFVGSLEYLPNSDAIIWFCREILPILRDRLDESVRFRVIGFGDTAMLDPIRCLPGVCLSGYQADLEPFYAKATAAVVPLRAGTGTRMKILEAFAYRRPVVSTMIGAEGLQVNPGEHLLVADSPADFAEACMTLVSQPILAERLTDNAARFCEETHSEGALGRRYDMAMLLDGPFPMDGKA